MSPIGCEEALRRVEAYLDGELSGPSLLELQRHLGRCEPCLGRTEFRRRLKALLAERCRCEVPEHLPARLRALLDTSEEAAGPIDVPELDS